MNEKQFLEMSDRKRDAFIAENVFGYQWVTWTEEAHKELNHTTRVKWLKYLDPKDKLHIAVTKEDLPFARFVYRGVPDYDTWDSLGKGIEHAHENRWDITLEQRHFLWDVIIWDDKRQPAGISRYSKNIFLAFWIAYMKALGVLE